MKHIILIVGLCFLGACATRPEEIGREPVMTPVGSGIAVDREPLPHLFKAGGRSAANSTWSNASADLFTSPRARQVGDIVTVNIQIDDKAEFDNASDRSRKSSISAGLDYAFSFKGWNADGTGDFGVDSSSSSNGQGTIDRSEKLRLSVAAVVNEVLPNGNVVISGSQEVRVNYELRILNIAGIVRPRDISPKNTISYDKIAEARVSYGGRGRLMEVQQPAYGQQIYDVVAPF
ncbi:flagellar basal body L-ring protein FlgH [Microvirga terrae]|uniref:Flagellar L-ring protein n=1 Tax=Microvirga terrae TaxID=2740529 RepID=A0ABY5RTD6_9HYPH|nr:MULTISPECIES: flagellar basal body L-ring protein FlgH [Microvirga]MBQ0824791.1 flagellar basal body L-ring protein FlgH [Microvirga sp. HBU67558]UVF20273.1 flagellar basal body L-ring protein FlgH [Microvirga terrae]